MSKTILFVDDEHTLRMFIAKSLRRDGYEVVEAESLAAARERLAESWIDMVILDRMLPDGEGLALLREINRDNPRIPVVMLTAHGAIDNAVAAMQTGAFDYLTKPVDLETLRARLQRMSETVNLRRELDHFRQQDQVRDHQWIVGSSPGMRRVATEIEQVAPTKATVLITGESGTGKEVVARVIQARSQRGDKPFRPINCAAVPDHLLKMSCSGTRPTPIPEPASRKKGCSRLPRVGPFFWTRSAP